MATENVTFRFRPNTAAFEAHLRRIEARVAAINAQVGRFGSMPLLVPGQSRVTAPVPGLGQVRSPAPSAARVMPVGTTAVAAQSIGTDIAHGAGIAAALAKANASLSNIERFGAQASHMKELIDIASRSHSQITSQIATLANNTNQLGHLVLRSTIDNINASRGVGTPADISKFRTKGKVVWADGKWALQRIEVQRGTADPASPPPRPKPPTIDRTTPKPIVTPVMNTPEPKPTVSAPRPTPLPSPLVGTVAGAELDIRRRRRDGKSRVGLRERVVGLSTLIEHRRRAGLLGTRSQGFEWKRLLSPKNLEKVRSRSFELARMFGGKVPSIAGMGAFTTTLLMAGRMQEARERNDAAGTGAGFFEMFGESLPDLALNIEGAAASGAAFIFQPLVEGFLSLESPGKNLLNWTSVLGNTGTMNRLGTRQGLNRAWTDFVRRAKGELSLHDEYKNHFETARRNRRAAVQTLTARAMQQGFSGTGYEIEESLHAVLRNPWQMRAAQAWDKRFEGDND